MHFYTYDPTSDIEIHRSYESNFIAVREKGTITSQFDRVVEAAKRAEFQLPVHMNSTTDYRIPYYYSQDKFHNYMTQWRRKIGNNDHVLVLIQQPISSLFTIDLIIHTTSDALTSKLAQVLLYLTRYDVDSVSLITNTFAQSINNGQLLLLLSESHADDFEKNTVNSGTHDDFNYAYLLDLAHQSKSNFTIIIPPGWHLGPNATNIDYVAQAIGHHKSIITTRKSMNDFNRTCWTMLSDNGASDVILLDSAEHTSRLSILLRSSLPYNQKNYTELRNLYCSRFISSAVVVYGPAMFTQKQSDVLQSQTVVKGVANMDINEKDIGVPKWINTTSRIGPIIEVVKYPVTIAFAVTAMIRPVVATGYLEQFLNTLLEMVETHFNEKSHFTAMIVVLMAGNTTEEVKTLRMFLEGKYTNALQRKVITLVDSPLESYTTVMSTMRPTFHLESHKRRYWRTKQNLDVGVLLGATVGLSEYVMLLEDDTGFQPEFANRLTNIIRDEATTNYTNDMLPWAQMVFGFGYSGILIRAIDVPVYAQLHTTFFDERPCDILDIWRLVRDGKRIYIQSPLKLRYKKRLYLKHLGLQSSLQGKTQEVW
jgi:hypothetical protein